MCLTCGCGEPGDEHDASGHLTVADFRKAAGAADISVKEAYENLKATMAKVDLEKEEPVKK